MRNNNGWGIESLSVEPGRQGYLGKINEENYLDYETLAQKNTHVAVKCSGLHSVYTFVYEMWHLNN